MVYSSPKIVETDEALLEAGDQHIVDLLIEERSTNLMRSPVWPFLKPFLYPLLGHRQAVEMADAIAPLTGREALAYIQDLLKINLSVDGLENIPKEGAFLLAANHPTGIPDGVAVYQALMKVREDIAIFTNRDAVRINPRLDEVLIPVEWRDKHRTTAKTKETLRATANAFKGGKAVVLFPSGRIAFWHKEHQRLTERPWQTSVISLARKHKVPIVPLHVSARNSGLFYFVSRFSKELRDMAVFYELLNKTGAEFSLKFGPAISHEILDGDQAELTEKLQLHVVEKMANQTDSPFEIS